MKLQIDDLVNDLENTNRSPKVKKIGTGLICLSIVVSLGLLMLGILKKGFSAFLLLEFICLVIAGIWGVSNAALLMNPAKKLSLPRLAAPLILLAAWIALSATSNWAHIEPHVAHDFWDAGIHCSTATLAMFFVIGAIAGFLIKKGASTKLAWSSLNMSAGAFAFAAMYVRSTCPSNEPWHLLTFHMFPMFIALLLGLWGIRWLIRW
jgi:hypothetical protein